MLYERNIVHKTKEYTLFSSPKRFTKHNTIHQEFQIECGKSSPSDLAFILAGVEGLISSLDYTEIKINRVVSDDGGLFIAIFADRPSTREKFEYEVAKEYFDKAEAALKAAEKNISGL